MVVDDVAGGVVVEVVLVLVASVGLISPVVLVVDAAAVDTVARPRGVATENVRGALTPRLPALSACSASAV